MTHPLFTAIRSSSRLCRPASGGRNANESGKVQGYDATQRLTLLVGVNRRKGSSASGLWPGRPLLMEKGTDCP